MKTPFLDAIKDGGLVGDGAMGSLLYERGVFPSRNFDELNLSQPELIFKVHRDYVLSGAQLIETNTYGANRIRLAKHHLEEVTGRINQAAVALAKQAGEGAVYVAGSMGPSGLTPGELRSQEKEVQKAYFDQAEILTEAGCDLLFLETFEFPLELKTAILAARAASKLPIVAHIKVSPTGQISDGTTPAQLAQEMKTWGADVVGANCSGPQAILDVVTQMVTTGLPVSAVPNSGTPQSIEDRQFYLATPENFGVFARRLYKAGVKMVGGCCGTGPTHVTRMAAAARMVVPKAHESTVEISLSSPGKPEVPLAERSHFGSQLGRRFVVSVEVDPGTALDVSNAVKSAKLLLEAGADIINIADGPRASVRMSNLAFGLKLQEALKTEVLLHVCTRDRNLLGLVSHLMGAHVLGFRNLVVITGDPPKLGDYPEATAVYDVDSIGLLRIINGFNRGVDPAGKSTATQTQFVLATGAEPAAQDFEREMVRLRQKIDAGANLIMTQPVYDPRHVERFLEAVGDVKIPILIGLLPLASSKNAEFLHHHVPGMGIPTAVRERMRKAGSGPAARKEGIAIALETLAAVRHRVSGAYVMVPLGRYDMAAELVTAIGTDRTLAETAPGRIA